MARASRQYDRIRLKLRCVLLFERNKKGGKCRLLLRACLEAYWMSPDLLRLRNGAGLREA